MCKCCQYCLETIYWHLIEKHFCYDETIAMYEDPERDEKNNNLFDNMAFYQQVSVIAGRSIVTIDQIPLKPKPIVSQPVRKIRWWEDATDQGTSHEEETKDTKALIQEIHGARLSKTDPIPKNELILNPNEPVKLRAKSLAERRMSKSLTLMIDRNLELPVIRQNSMPKFYLDTPDPNQLESSIAKTPALVLSPVRPKTAQFHFDLNSVVELDRESRESRVPVPIHRHQSTSRLILIRDRLKSTKLRRQASASNLPNSIQHI